MLGANFQGLSLIAGAAHKRAGVERAAVALERCLGKAEGTGPTAEHCFCFWEDLKKNFKKII